MTSKTYEFTIEEILNKLIPTKDTEVWEYEYKIIKSEKPAHVPDKLRFMVTKIE